MTLDVEILDYKDLDDSRWILCKSSLIAYLENLKPEFYEYIIQRKIVKNRYLNSLLETILSGEPVPIITLTSSEKFGPLEKGASLKVKMDQIEILDGLQRTFRMWAYYRLIKEFEKNSNLTPMEFAKNVKELYPEFFDVGILTLTKIKELYTGNQFKEIKSAFTNFDFYFFLWGGLTQTKIIHKMLVLNAGQRPVSLMHQYELLFLYVWEEAKKTSGVKLFRERDPLANRIKLGERNAGEYMFSSVIAGLRSYLENKPKRISIDDLDIEDLQQLDTNGQVNESVFTKPFITKFLQRLKGIDEAVIKKEKEDGKKWFVRDTTLSGVLAGLGKYVNVSEKMAIDEIDHLTDKGFNDLNRTIGAKGFSLQEFQTEYYNLQSRTVNVGTYVRAIIMDYTYKLLRSEPVSWKTLFEQAKTSNK